MNTVSIPSVAAPALASAANQILPAAQAPAASQIQSSAPVQGVASGATENVQWLVQALQVEESPAADASSLDTWSAQFVALMPREAWCADAQVPAVEVAAPEPAHVPEQSQKHQYNEALPPGLMSMETPWMRVPQMTMDLSHALSSFSPAQAGEVQQQGQPATRNLQVQSDLPLGTGTGEGALGPELEASPQTGSHAVMVVPDAAIRRSGMPTESVTPRPDGAVSVHKGATALVQALAQRLQVQSAQGVDIATVRLDPPQMGQLEIRIRQDASGIQVQLMASNAEVGRQLSALVDALRQELQQRSQDASVTVGVQSRTLSDGSHGQRQGSGHGQPDNEPQIGQALHAADGSTLS